MSMSIPLFKYSQRYIHLSTMSVLGVDFVANTLLAVLLKEFFSFDSEGAMIVPSTLIPS